MIMKIQELYEMSAGLANSIEALKTQILFLRRKPLSQQQEDLIISVEKQLNHKPTEEQIIQCSNVVADIEDSFFNQPQPADFHRIKPGL